MNIQEIADLAKQGGRLAASKQWILADALADLSPTEVSSVAVVSKRNESTLLQYARAAERWPVPDRVDGVSFSAHRVALSWNDPRALLLDLKQKHGSPTVRQVRQAMGLEGHPAIELLEKGLGKIDRQVSVEALRGVIAVLLARTAELDGEAGSEEVTQGIEEVDKETDFDYDKYTKYASKPAPEEYGNRDTEQEAAVGMCKNCGKPTTEQYTDGSYLCDTCDGLSDLAKAAAKSEPEPEPTVEVWTPPLRTSDVAGL